MFLKATGVETYRGGVEKVLIYICFLSQLKQTFMRGSGLSLFKKMLRKVSSPSSISATPQKPNLQTENLFCMVYSFK